MNINEILSAQLKALEEKKSCCLVTLLEAGGQTPRSNGKMLVFEDGTSLGTVGGGTREKRAVLEAEDCIKYGTTKVMEFDFESEKSASGEECGGKIRLLFETYVSRPQLVMVGAGHVGKCVLKLASVAGFDTTLIDDREESEIPDAIALASNFVKVENFGEALKNVTFPADCYVAVASHSHAGDADALEAILLKNPVYVGMIGSAKKKASTWEKLLSRGITQEMLDRVFCPIGFDFGGETPEEIALGIAAQILAVKNGVISADASKQEGK